MIARCRENKIEDESIWSKDSTPLDELLIIGKYYIVYGIIFKEQVFIEILLSENRRYTDTLPISLFEITDNRLSKSFVLGEIILRKNLNYPFISFKEWATNKLFFEKLVDGDNETVAIFNIYRELFYLEYKHPEITESAIAVQNNWVQCPICTEAWEIKHPTFEMCKCPKCKTVLINPYGIKKSDEVIKESL